jgi:hypothetical protein
MDPANIMHNRHYTRKTNYNQQPTRKTVLVHDVPRDNDVVNVHQTIQVPFYLDDLA